MRGLVVITKAWAYVATFLAVGFQQADFQRFLAGFQLAEAGLIVQLDCEIPSFFKAPELVLFCPFDDAIAAPLFCLTAPGESPRRIAELGRDRLPV